MAGRPDHNPDERFEVEKVPEHRKIRQHRTKYPFDNMKPGSSFAVEVVAGDKTQRHQSRILSAFKRWQDLRNRFDVYGKTAKEYRGDKLVVRFWLLDASKVQKPYVVEPDDEFGL